MGTFLISRGCRASTDQAESGGDFFDFFDASGTPTGDAVVVIGDVQGHSLAAAVVNAGHLPPLMTGLITAAADKSDDDVALVLAETGSSPE